MFEHQATICAHKPSGWISGEAAHAAVQEHENKIASGVMASSCVHHGMPTGQRPNMGPEMPEPNGPRSPSVASRGRPLPRDNSKGRAREGI